LVKFGNHPFLTNSGLPNPKYPVPRRNLGFGHQF